MLDDPPFDYPAARRRDDTFRFWVPIIISIASTLLTVGVIYGKLGGRLDLIEYRLGQIESRIVSGK